jgi:hypothetical protein
VCVCVCVCVCAKRGGRGDGGFTMDETIQQLDGRITTVVSSIFALQVRLTAHREHQPRHDKVLRLLPLNVTRHQARRIGQPGRI